MQIRRWKDPEALADACASELVAIAAAAVAARGGCHIALSGGSTPKRMFQLLAKRELPGAIDWWWGDERTVPPDDADSNYHMAKENLLEPLGIPSNRVHRMRGEDPDFAQAASDYEQAVVTALGSPPVFDLVLLGMGPDGHTASLFPGTPGLQASDRWVVANPVDSPVAKGKTTRITLTAPAINAARHVRFAVAGADKADTLHAVLEGPRDPMRYPSQLIASVDLVWHVDEAAAAKLGAP
jgi:6-phosphogluconolactonase